MASVLDKYGIKEVADVTFYEIDANNPNVPGKPVLYLDTLKVSTVEQTAETAEARGGKGNAALISWDYGKEINVTLEDALFSVKSMEIMYGDLNGAESLTSGTIKKTIKFTGSTLPESYESAGKKIKLPSEVEIYNDKGEVVESISETGTYLITFDETITEMHTIDISANKFPGTYYITGDTYARSEKTGKDEFFQFIIPKAKVLSENTLTLEAEGDPSVFNMNLKVLRPENGVMMKLVKYDVSGI